MLSRIKLISSLRNSTRASLNLCRMVIDKNSGNTDTIFLEKEILKLSEEKGDTLKNSILFNGSITINETNDAFLMFSLKCKTDFVAKCSSFIDYTSKITSNDQKINSTIIHTLSGIVQEPIEISPIISFDKSPLYTIGTYIHNKFSPFSGIIGSMVKISFDKYIPEKEKIKIANDVAVHISGLNPETIEDLLNQQFLKCPNESTTKEFLFKSNNGSNPTIISFKRMSIK